LNTTTVQSKDYILEEQKRQTKERERETENQELLLVVKVWENMI
jgi:hypothetical protein